MNEQERRKVMERLLEQMKRPGADAQQGIRPAPEQPPQGSAPVPTVVQRAPIGSDQVQLTYDNADLYEFVNQIADTLGITPIVIDPEVKGTVTIHSSAPMSKEDIFPLFNLILKNNNAALVKQGNIYQIVPTSAALKRGLEIIDHLPPVAPPRTSQGAARTAEGERDVGRRPRRPRNSRRPALPPRLHRSPGRPQSRRPCP